MYDRINKLLEQVIIDGQWKKVNIKCRSLYQTLAMLNLIDNKDTFLINLYNFAIIQECEVGYLFEFESFMNEGLIY